MENETFLLKTGKLRDLQNGLLKKMRLYYFFEFLSCHRVLCAMVITCFMVHYMLRINISLAIVEMVQSENSTNSSSSSFDWDEYQKNDILGLFYWGFLLTAVPGGRLSEIYGTKRVMGWAMVTSSILTIVTPLAAYIHYYCILVVRILLGLALGVSWPSIPPMAIKWVGPKDTSKFMAHTIASALGACITLILGGYIIAFLGWASIFYITGGISLVWSLLWFYLVYDSPEQHPRISAIEKRLIEEKTRSRNANLAPVPWLKVLTSMPVWAIIVAEFCQMFSINLILNELPSYMNKLLHVNIKENGLLSSLPFLVTYIMAVAFSYVADNWRKSGKFSTLTIRKHFTLLNFTLPAILYLIQIFWGYLKIVSIIVFTFSQGFFAACNGGSRPNTMDIAPAYAGTILGLSFMASGSTGYFSSKVVAIVTAEEVSFQRWRYVFWLLIVLDVIGCAFFWKFASAEVQKWNPPDLSAVEMTELTLKNKKSEETLVRT